MNADHGEAVANIAAPAISVSPANSGCEICRRHESRFKWSES